MSLEQILQVWDADVGDAMQQVLIVLANAADDDGNNVYPSQAWTAWRARLSYRQVKRIFKELRRGVAREGEKSKGPVLVLVRRGSRRIGERRSNEYKLRLDRLPKKPSFKDWCKANGIPYTANLTGDTMSPDDLESGDIEAKSGDTETGESGDTMSPKTKGGETKGKKGEGGAARARRPTRREAAARPSPIPPDFAVSHEMFEWARQNTPRLRREVIVYETALFVLRMRSSGKLSYDWIAEWQIALYRKHGWLIADEEKAAQNSTPQLPFETPPPARKPDPDCKLCFGTGLEVVQGKGARRCACIYREGDKPTD